MTTYLISINDEELDALATLAGALMEKEDADVPESMTTLWLKLVRRQAQRRTQQTVQAPPWPSFPTDRD